MPETVQPQPLKTKPHEVTTAARSVHVAKAAEKIVKQLAPFTSDTQFQTDVLMLAIKILGLEDFIIEKDAT